MADKDVILEVRDLKKYFKSPTGTLHAVDGVNFSIRRGETLGLVGESGCGKSTIGRLILGLHQATSGEILFNGQDICKMNKQQLHDLRKDLQIIFQDPFSSLNPRMSIGEIIGEPLQIHGKVHSRAELDKEVSRLMEWWASPPGCSTPIPTSWTAAAASGWASPGPCRSSRSSSSATSRCPHWTCPSRPRS